MCPFSKSPWGHDSEETPERVLHSPSVRPMWAQQARGDVGKKKTFRSTILDSMSMADSIIGRINFDADVRIIFLDIDGVINHPNGDNWGTSICPNCVIKLKSILAHTSAKIVLSSTWRLNKHLRKTLFRHLRAIEINQGVVVGETRDLRKDRKNRAEEINEWLGNPKLYKKKDITSFDPWQVQSWVSLDDMDLASMQPDHQSKSQHIKLDPKLGLCGTDSIEISVIQGLSKRMWLSMRAVNSSLSDSSMYPKNTGRSCKELLTNVHGELLTPGPQWSHAGHEKITLKFDEASPATKILYGHESHKELVELEEAPEDSLGSASSIIEA